MSDGGLRGCRRSGDRKGVGGAETVKAYADDYVLVGELRAGHG